MIRRFNFYDSTHKSCSEHSFGAAFSFLKSVQLKENRIGSNSGDKNNYQKVEKYSKHNINSSESKFEDE